MTDFKMGVASTLPELSEWTLITTRKDRTDHPLKRHLKPNFH